MLVAKGISKSFNNHCALHQVDLEVPSGAIFGLLGPNGAGKTTLIRILTSITAPDEGVITFNGKPLSELDRNFIGYLPEERGLYRKMKVWEQALYLVRLKGLSFEDASANLKTWFRKLKMEDWWNKPVENLSKGMQQRLQFVISVAHDPQLIILDEPFSGFDPIHADELKQEIINLKKSGKTILLSTHNMESVEELCDHVMFINRGEAILSGSILSIKKQFSKSLFDVQFEGSRMAFANALGHQFEITEITEQHGKFRAVIRGHVSVETNDLLRALLGHVQLISFAEQLPSMNDIFIDLISEAATNHKAA